MSLRKILQTIDQETEKEVQKIKKQAEKESRKILIRAKEKAQKIKQKTLDDFKLKKTREADALLRKNENKAYKTILEKKRAILDSVFNQALEELKKSAPEKFFEKLKKNLPQKGKIIQNNQGRGFKFVSKTVEIDCTLPCLIKEAREKIETKTAKILFN